jgi:hypothetical protein
VGGLDGTFSGAQDWELQHRVRQAGGMVWMDPALALGERAPGAIGELAAQTFRAGAWRRKVIAAHAATSTPRYLAAPTLVVALVAAVAGGLAGGAMGLGLMWWLAAAPALYAAAVAVGAAVAGAGLPLGGRVRLWWALIVIQLSWGAGFLVGLRRRAARASAGRPGPTDTMMR